MLISSLSLCQKILVEQTDQIKTIDDLKKQIQPNLSPNISFELVIESNKVLVPGYHSLSMFFGETVLRCQYTNNAISTTIDKKKYFLTNGNFTPGSQEDYYQMDSLLMLKQENGCLDLPLSGFRTIFGPPSSGKTTSLLAIADLVKNTFTPTYISLQDLDNRSFQYSEWFFKGLGDLLKKKYPSLFHAIDIIDGSDFLEFFGYHRLEDSPFPTKLVLLIDDFDRIYYKCNKETIEGINQFFGALKGTNHWILHSIIVAGSYSLIEQSLMTRYHAPFSLFDSTKISSFTLQDIKYLFQKYQHNSSTCVEPEVIEDIYHRTEGHPGLVSLFGQVIDNYLKPGMSLSYRQWCATFSPTLVDIMTKHKPTFNLIQTITSEAKNTNYQVLMDSLWTIIFMGYIFEGSLIIDQHCQFRDRFLVSKGLAKKTSMYDQLSTISNPSVRHLLLENIELVNPNIIIPKIPFPLLDASEEIIDIPLLVRNLVSKALVTFKKTYHLYSTHLPYLYHSEFYSILKSWKPNSVSLSTNIDVPMPSDETKRGDLVLGYLTLEGHKKTCCLEIVAYQKDEIIIGHIERVAKLYQPIIGYDQVWVINITARQSTAKSISSPFPNVKLIHVIHDLETNTFSFKEHI
ncbi:hypothetical protein DFA_01187 [Cavenderia fasciculata]|uniref:Uncharacterized protein n=1 Tax=Cavenderia fasciculata TaxID=261658 RepID=F4PRA6_CACFS|nr:uncharacterized protein DFA_01187 [Cavenderia fasciculata]EGG21306.1 hypothetical protein DFA_01187 [Cavenderia fasciculata]|eukprot:XP_004359156.1 hypothetical protein DFA_01187 [Cavenderia fasciculata]